MLDRDVLWIGYGRRAKAFAQGGLGKMEVRSHRFSALTAPLIADAAGEHQSEEQKARRFMGAQEPSKQPIHAICSVRPGELWLAGEELLRYSITSNTWTMKKFCDRISGLAADKVRERVLIGRLDWFAAENGGLSIDKHDWKSMSFYDDLPAKDVSAVAADGKVAWVGGMATWQLSISLMVASKGWPTSLPDTSIKSNWIRSLRGCGWDRMVFTRAAH